MRRLSFIGALALVAGLLIPGLITPPATATVAPGPRYAGPYFGENNFPPGCTRDNSADNPANGCFRIVTGLNGLDSPQVDVLVLVPVSATAERDMRIMRQSVEMWEGGIDVLAQQMGLDWLAEGVDFHVTIDYVDLENGGEFTTYPIVDPEIVVIATNPVGGAGIGADPVDLTNRTGISPVKDVPCHPVPNVFDFEQWEALPGFNSHHESRSGTYVEDCGPEGGGGNVCFAVNGAIDPAPAETTDDQVVPGAVPFDLFDLVSHEFGHCLSVGHVGDGGEAILGNGWGVVPATDIMSYQFGAPAERTKCVSTLDVEAIAVRMSQYLDVNGDGAVNAADHLEANDQVGSPDGLNPLQVQHPHDYHHASATGAAVDCPQPDIENIPTGERTNWMPAPVVTYEPTLAAAEGPGSAGADATINGTVEYVRTGGNPATPMPAEPAAPPAYDGTLTQEHTGIFEVEHSGFGLADGTPADASDVYSLNLSNADVRMELTWADFIPIPPPSDLDLLVTGAADSGNAGVTSGQPEIVELEAVTGELDIRVRPTFVNTLTSYTLKITVTPRGGDFGGLGAPDVDFDGIANDADSCPHYPGIGADGCTPLRATEVSVSLSGSELGSALVHADYGSDNFSIPVDVPAGTHELAVTWLDGDTVLDQQTLTVTGEDTTPPADRDGDGVADASDNCADVSNAAQSDIDGDAVGDDCDADMDGDGFTNEREIQKGTDPRDPASKPPGRKRN